MIHLTTGILLCPKLPENYELNSSEIQPIFGAKNIKVSVSLFYPLMTFLSNFWTLMQWKIRYPRVF